MGKAAGLLIVFWNHCFHKFQDRMLGEFEFSFIIYFIVFIS